MLWLGRGSSRVSSVPFILFIFLAFAPLTLWCNAELGREASRAAEASRVEAQRLKEKAEASWVEAQHWKEKAEASQVKA